MATKKSKKVLVIGAIVLVLGFVYRPIKSKYVDSNGALQPGDKVVRTGLFTVKHSDDPNLVGVLSLLGRSITWCKGGVVVGSWNVA